MPNLYDLLWVLVIKHRTGQDDDVFIHMTKEGALDQLHAYVVISWPYEVDENEPIPDDPRTAIGRYFMFTYPAGEEYTLVERAIYP